MHRLPVHADAPEAQSPSDVQPHWPPPGIMMQTCPFWLTPQSLQTAPLLPHS